MWIADGWNDYEVIDCSEGEKLERWATIFWFARTRRLSGTPQDTPRWKKMNGHYHRSSKGGGEWEFFDLPEQWSIHYKELTFNLNRSASSTQVSSRSRRQTGTGSVTVSAMPDAQSRF